MALGETNMDNFLPFGPFTYETYAIMLNSIRDKESYLNNLDSDTRAYVMRNLDDSYSFSDIERCISELKG